MPNSDAGAGYWFGVWMLTVMIVIARKQISSSANLLYFFSTHLLSTMDSVPSSPIKLFSCPHLFCASSRLLQGTRRRLTSSRYVLH